MKWDFSRLNQLKREKEYRERRDIDWRDVAVATGVMEKTLIRYRRNEVTRPHLNVVLALCDYFGVDISYFQADDEDQGAGVEEPEESSRL